tara:strand:+ start:82 stop:504 length:423 start_codon:yes stop_codon:yes gene_type:complete
MKKLLIIPIIFLAFNLFSQDLKYGDGLFEANFVVDMMYSDDLNNYKMTASGEAGPYGRAYLSYNFTSHLGLSGQGEFTGTAWTQNGEEITRAILRGIYRKKGNTFKLYTFDNLSNGKFIVATGELDMVKKTLNFKASYVE